MGKKRDAIWGLGILEYLAERRMPKSFVGRGWERWKVLAALALFRYREENILLCGLDFSRRVLRGACELLGEDSRPVWVLQRRLEGLGGFRRKFRPRTPEGEASGFLWIIRSEANRRAQRCIPGRFFRTPRQGRECRVRRKA